MADSLQTVSTGHVVVSDATGDIVGELACTDFLSHVGRVGIKNAIAGAFEKQATQESHLRIVIDQENCVGVFLVAHLDTGSFES